MFSRRLLLPPLSQVLHYLFYRLENVLCPTANLSPDLGCRESIAQTSGRLQTAFLAAGS